VPVTLTITADMSAGVDAHPTEIHVVGSVNGGPMVRLLHNLNFRVDVNRAPPPLITWTPSNDLGVLSLQQGQTITRTVSFTSNMALSNVQLVSALNLHFVHIVIQPASLANVAINSTVPVTFTITADKSAGVAVHPTDIHLLGSFSGGPVVRLFHSLNFRVDVERAPPPPQPLISWMPGNDLGKISVLQGQTITETVSFTSDTALTNVQLLSSLNLHHVHITILPASLASVAVNVTVPVTFTITADTSAGIDVHPTDLFLVGSFNGGPAVRLWHVLDLLVDVKHAI
jgi:hypothetical protein